MRNIFLEKVGANLSNIMEDRGIKSAQKLSDMMGGSDKTRNINYHRGGGNMRISQLDEYCDFFGCSADYLLGYIPEETHELTDIAEATGLSKGAIECLKEMDEESKAVLNYLLDGYDAPICPLLCCMSIFESRHVGSMKALHDLLDNPESTDTQADYIKAKQAEDLADHDMKEYCDQVIENWKNHVEGQS